MADPIKIDSDRLRIDMETEFGEVQPDGTVEIRMRPNPDRYEWLEDEDRGRILRDVKTGFMYPESVLEELAEQLQGAPIFGPADIPDPQELFRERRAAIEAALAGEKSDEGWSDPAGSAFAEQVGQDLEFAVLCADLVDSTRLQAENPQGYNAVVPLLLGEISAVTARFGGRVIKYTGDGGIVGFSGRGFNVSSDLAFDAATALVADIYGVLNPLLKKADLPELDVRVGIDANRGTVTAVGTGDNRRQPDVLGIAVSMASKIEGQGAPREVWTGQTLYEILHVQRQQYLSPAPTPAGWNFVDRSGQPYGLYRVAVAPTE